ncbi:Hypothetical predicted protein [Paramuricea clavata]|uniref:DUF7041 domain-containing protein n=1 Tax=Paramuricea clavata TaxID=317549 RepID=A0A7D9MEQ1_PARCT|nr:Hypothetical predicted protein [Paramuricea clavata]
MPPKKLDERLLFDRFENINERLDSMVKSAEAKAESSCQPATAKILATAILKLSREHEEAYSEWISSTAVSEDKILSNKKIFNRTAMSCDNILVALQIVGNPKLWFEQLEIIFKTMEVTSQDQKFAGLLRLLDESTSSLLAAITRAKPMNPYDESKTVLIKHFSLSKFDRVKAYLEASPAHEEKLSLFFSRVEVLVDDISMTDVRKYCVLRHAPPQVRLQLAGTRFDSMPLNELIAEADILTQRANLDALTVAAFVPKGKNKNKKSKVCGFHRKFGKEAMSCTGSEKCIFWKNDLRFIGDNDGKGNDSGTPSRG